MILKKKNKLIIHYQVIVIKHLTYSFSNQHQSSLRNSYFFSNLTNLLILTISIILVQTKPA